VNVEASLLQEKNDVAQYDFFGSRAFDGEQIAGPDRRDHAASQRPDCDRAARVQHFARKLKPHVASRTADRFHAPPYDLRGRPRHWNCVPEILPQANAIVSNTFS
jgi:hypothetical protein